MPCTLCIYAVASALFHTHAAAAAAHNCWHNSCSHHIYSAAGTGENPSFQLLSLAIFTPVNSLLVSALFNFNTIECSPAHPVASVNFYAIANGSALVNSFSTFDSLRDFHSLIPFSVHSFRSFSCIISFPHSFRCASFNYNILFLLLFF